jgi:hypothetical protein
MSDIIDINVAQTVEDVTINVVDNVIQVNINQVNGGGGSQTLNETLINGNATDGEDIFLSDGDSVLLDNGSKLKKGTTNAGNGGNNGIALKCSLDYEFKWEAGRMYIMQQDGVGIRETRYNFNVAPTVNDDDTKGYGVDSRWILDNGDVYVCTDATEGAAVWELQSTIPTLQQVTDAGNETTQYIKVKDSEKSFTLQSNGISFEDLDDGGNTLLRFEDTSLVDQEVLIRGLSGTLALLSDITIPTFQEVTDEGATTTNAIETGNIIATDVGGGDPPFVGKYDSNNGIGKIIMEDTSTNNYHELIFNAPTDSPRSITFKDESGTVALLSDIPTIDATPTDGSSNAVSSNGVFDALATKVSKSDYTPAHSILVQQSGTGTPSALQVGNNTLVGRLSGGGSDINDLSVSDVRTLLDIDTDLATKVNKSRFIYQPKVSVTGVTGETNLCSFKIDGGTYENTDAFKFDFTPFKSVTASASTWKVYIGLTSGARTNQILGTALTTTQRTSDATRRYNIDSGSLDCAVPFTANAISGLGGQTSLNTPISVNMANDLWITITANPTVISESHGVLMASITPLK